MNKRTLILLKKGNYIALAKKLRGFGADLYNGYGGKLEEGESIEEAAIRELQEECDVHAEIKNLQKVGVINFYFIQKPEHDQQVHWFILKDFDGEPKGTEEMSEPNWYTKESLPVEEMWDADRVLVPKILSGDTIEGDVFFNESGCERIELK